MWGAASMTRRISKFLDILCVFIGNPLFSDHQGIVGMNGLYRGTAVGYQRGITGIKYCVVRPHWDIVKGRFIE